MKNVRERNNKKTGFFGLSKGARIAVIATAALLLAAIIFGIVWTNIDHSYRYDRVDLSQFFKDGRISIDFDGLGKFPLNLATAVSQANVYEEIDKNMQASDEVKNTAKKGAEALINKDRSYNDTVYMYYEIFRGVDKDGKVENGDLLMSNTDYFKAGSTTLAAAAGGASIVRLGKNGLNEVLEAWMLEYYDTATSVTRVIDEGKKPSDYPGYTLVLEVKGEYEKEGTKKTYISLPNFYYQPTTQPADQTKSYYKGNDKVLTADKTKTPYDASVTTPDPDVITAVNDAAAELAASGAIGGEPKTVTLDATIDGGTTAYPTTFTVALKAMFLAEQKIATIDLDNDEVVKGMTFTYKDGSSEKKITDGKFVVRLTVESVLSLSEEVVNILARDTVEDGNIVYKSGFTAPTPAAGDDQLKRDNAFALAYMKYIQAEKIRTSSEDIMKTEATYLATVKTALWKKIVDEYSKEDIITSLPESEMTGNYEATMAAHTANYQQYYKSQYKSLEEYILKMVYEDEESVKLPAESQAAKVKEYIEKDLREAICEKIILFAIADHYDISASRSEWRAYKSDYQKSLTESNFENYKKYYKTQLAAKQISEGEIRIMAEDDAKTQANAYTDTYYRECVVLRKVQEKLLPGVSSIDKSLITWVLSDDPVLEDGHNH